MITVKLVKFDSVSKRYVAEMTVTEDLPPPDAVLSPASRDVLTMVKGIRNEPPILY